MVCSALIFLFRINIEKQEFSVGLTDLQLIMKMDIWSKWLARLFTILHPTLIVPTNLCTIQNRKVCRTLVILFSAFMQFPQIFKLKAICPLNRKLASPRVFRFVYVSSHIVNEIVIHHTVTEKSTSD